MEEINILSWIMVGCLIAAAYFLGKLDGRTQNLARLLYDGYLATKETSEGKLELVKHPNR